MANPEKARQSLLEAAALVLEQALTEGRRGVLASRLVSLLAYSSKLFWSASLLDPYCRPSREVRSHASDLPPDSLTDLVSTEGGEPHVRVCDSS